MIEVSLAILALASSVAGPPSAAPPAGSDGQFVRIFISPAGEPFRSSAGDYPSRAWFDLADANHDGRLTASEMTAQARTFFQKIDLNQNGKIDGDEIGNYENNIAPETRTLTSSSQYDQAPVVDDYISSLGGIAGRDAPPMQSTPRPKKIEDTPRGAGRFSFFNFAEPVMRADTDLSGSVTLDEFEALQRLQFSKLDANHRGYLEFGDFPRTPAQGMKLRLKSR